MPKGRYEALPAHDELDEEDDLEQQQGQQTLPRSAVTIAGPSATHSYGTTPRRPAVQHRRTRSGTVLSAIDVSALDAKLKQWTSALNSKFAKGKGKARRDTSKPYEIIASAFGAVEPAEGKDFKSPIKTLDHDPPRSPEDVEAVVEDVKVAIRLGVHPKLNKAGTSGSYFAKSPDGKTRAIFKPKNEEPYGSLNPKWSKWLHKNLLSPFFGFGRACLVPNFSYLSETGASLLSDRLEVYIVPHTSLVSLSSPAFFYDWIDRAAYKQKKRALPEKIGSFQLFLDGYKDASEFLRDHPWPGRAARDTLDYEGVQSGRRKKRTNWTRKCRLLCGTAGFDDDSDDEDDDYGSDEATDSGQTAQPDVPFTWTYDLMEDFRLELEKLVILDVLMRNTDRGLDNFMVKVCQGKCRSRTPSYANLKREQENAESKVKNVQPQPQATLAVNSNGIVDADNRAWTDKPHIHIAAIDNSLSFPIHHPNSWRSYCYGWLFLPSSLVGQPFSRATRDHFLPLLTSPIWWAQTVYDLRQLFSKDEDFSERMFKRQISVLKGQAWNVVMSLRDPEAGPLELCRRTTCVVHDDEITVADDDTTKEMLEAATEPEHPLHGGDTGADDGPTYRPSMERNHSVAVERPSTPHNSARPGMQRGVSDSPKRHHLSVPKRMHISPRPISVARHVDLNRATFGNATGVSMLEHMERLQKQEELVARSLGTRLPNDLDEEEEGLDRPVGGMSRSRSYRQGISLDLGRDTAPSRFRSGSIDGSTRQSAMPPVPAPPSAVDETVSNTKIVIVERVEEVDARPYFVRW